ncbi:alanine racemase [Deltaproteobacteria bacterium IMCC39524]|nr:alanine racemase [Deltaproteobacteria bacterium IMCC39524]
MSVTRPTRVEIDLAALRHNFQEVQRTVGDGCEVLAVVKADAYGHGVGLVAPALAAAGAKLFGVALVEEGVELRKLGIEQPILILGSFFPGQEADVIEYQLTPVLYDLACARRLDSAARDAGRSIDYHLKVDTGMGRLGFRVDRLDEVLPVLKNLKSLNMSGVMSHLAVADEPEKPLTALQCEAFSAVVARVEKAGFRPFYKHIANSAGIYSRKLNGCNLVRPGISLYGGLTGGPFAHPFTQQSVMHFVSQVAQLKDVPSGEGISYGHRFVTSRQSRVAAIPVGYADGYNRLLTNRGEVLIHGRRAPVVGTVCMDWILVDVTSFPDVQVGDQVSLLGRDGDDIITAEEWADKVGSITYEVFCNISKRVPRVPVNL